MPDDRGQQTAVERCAEPAAIAKADARRRALAARDALPQAERVRLSSAICARAIALPELREAATLFSFAAFRSEVDTAALTAWALAEGKVLCLPRILGPHLMAAYRVTDPATDLPPGTWGIPEPREGLPEVDPATLDAIVVPGSVFDPAGRRSGYGGGFYDSYMARTRAGVPRIALAFELQIVLELPCEAHDLPVTAIVTEKRVIRPG
jgi:5-formyltetrahydrofolate cyclo-ligase